MADYGSTDRVRSSASVRFVTPARKRREKTLQIHSGTLAKTMVAEGLLAPNRHPIVCNALRSRRFLDENRLRIIEERTNAESGLSSDVTFVYSIEGDASGAGNASDLINRFEKMRGLLKKTYAVVGGAERAILSERKHWDR